MPSTVSHGRWAAGSNGGCPKDPTWINNPQYLILPAPDAEASFTIELHSDEQKLPIGFVVLKAPKDGSGRCVDPKLRKSDVIHKSTWRATSPEKPILAEVVLPASVNGYIVIPSTHDAGPLAAFELKVSSEAYFTTELVAQEAGAPAGPGAASPIPRSPKAATGKPAAECVDCQEPNVPQIASEGQGLSAKQLKDVEAMVAKALAQCAATPGQKYQDPDFPASKASLWENKSKPSQEIGADPVVAWRRPEEWNPSARLFPNPGEPTGIVAGPLSNLWLLAACNIVAGDIDVIAKTFVDSTHAAQGFYIVRFFVDDPTSDDDWVVVLVDDRVPCGFDARPCFARTPDDVLWVSILEKAFAKWRGCYEATCFGSVEEGLLYLTGGLSRDLAIPPALSAGGGRAELDTFWTEIMSLWTTAHVIGCEVRSVAEVEGLAETGLLPNIPYAVLTGGDLPCGRMLRLRTFHGYSEWRGKWSDDDPGWTNRLRNMMQYSDSNDGTFWMSFDDFCRWFNVLYVCRRADDQWTRMTVRSSWSDATAGGCCPNFLTWRTNPQWLLRIRKTTKLAISLTLPPATAASGVAEHAICIQILAGNPGADARRRRLQLSSEADLLVPSEPRFTSRMMTEVTLEASDTPYVLMPCMFAPGHESQFTLVVRSDDCDDDGVPDFGFDPVAPKNDWKQGAFDGAWPDARPGGVSLAQFPQVQLHVSTAGRFFIFVDQLGVSSDMREEEGLQSETNYPSIGLALGVLGDPFTSLEESVGHVAAQPRDGTVFECRLLESETPYVVVPFLEDLAGALARHPQLRYRVCVYSDVEFSLGDKPQRSGGGAAFAHGWSQTKHWGAPPHPVSRKLPLAECTAFCNCTCDPISRECPMHNVYKRLHALQVGLDAQLKFLTTLK
ncbi:hypothetical protein AB1Y20_003686 [Prymnesium parvum]|uniref:Calpain catalytic domain-containing protein n=1 Tax=Prymnesium parvum TaxID=97485 RepID=A0AB34J8D1_PRYPA